MNTVTSSMRSALEALFSQATEEPPQQRQFEPSKKVAEQDLVLVDMLNSAGHEQVSYCVCDPDQVDCPIVFASDGFCRFTGYDSNEIEGRNCRFLQGPETSKEDVDKIRTAIQQHKEASVNLVNYRKDGTKFFNEFFLGPLHNDAKEVVYFVGVQCAVPHLGPGQSPANPGWVYNLGKHV